MPAALDLNLLPELAVFVRVADSASFTQAAKQLGSSPSTLSRTVQRLEHALSARLLERSTRQVRLTAVGAQVLLHARQMVMAASQALDAASEAAQQPRGAVSLSAPTEFAHALIHPAVNSFLRRWPEVQLRLVASDAALDPLTHGLDVVLHLGEAPAPHLAGRPLGRVHWRLCASRAYLAARGRPKQPQDLAQHDCVVLGEHPLDRRWQLQPHAGAAAGAIDTPAHRRTSRAAAPDVTVSVSGRYAVNHAQARLDAALQDMGIAALPDFVCHTALATGALELVLPDWTLRAQAYAGQIWLLYPPNRFLPPQVRALIEHLAAHFAERDAALASTPAPKA